jgi:hypothetical protein
MDAFGTVSNVIQLVSQAMKLYRHIAESRYFECIAGQSTVEISLLVEYSLTGI